MLCDLLSNTMTCHTKTSLYYAMLYNIRYYTLFYFTRKCYALIFLDNVFDLFQLLIMIMSVYLRQYWEFCEI